ncbi:MAG TPA: hypothetical protein VKX28_06775 [Xanthobacteraceae bacterium]|jgi:hypothetical protein|nr:hypothetical protein [Xanthobacteraceae bacterium]
MLLRLLPARVAAALAAIVLLALPAQAADPVFPGASHVGLVVPAGLKPSTTFRGFVDPDVNASVLILEVPPPVYSKLEAEMSAEGLKKQGMTEEKRETVTLNSGKALIVVGDQAVGDKTLHKWVMLASGTEMGALIAVQLPAEAKAKYPDAEVRAMLMTLVMRASVPIDEQLKLVPVVFGDLSGLRPFRVLGNSSVFLTEGPADPKDVAAQPLLIVSVAPGGPEQDSDRANFARQVLFSMGDFKDLRIVGTDIIRLDNLPTYEIQAEAKDAKTDAALKVVQWIRFGHGALLRFLGIAPTAAWSEAFPKFRAVRDGVKPRSGG